MIERANGLFYDQEGIQYHHSGIEGAYKFNQVTLILDKTSFMNVVHLPEA